MTRSFVWIRSRKPFSSRAIYFRPDYAGVCCFPRTRFLFTTYMYRQAIATTLPSARYWIGHGTEDLWKPDKSWLSKGVPVCAKTDGEIKRGCFLPASFDKTEERLIQRLNTQYYVKMQVHKPRCECQTQFRMWVSNAISSVSVKSNPGCEHQTQSRVWVSNAVLGLSVKGIPGLSVKRNPGSECQT